MSKATENDTKRSVHSKSDPRDLWPLRHLIRVMRKHNLTNILTICTILTIFYIFFMILTITDNFDNCWQFLPFFTILTIYRIFDDCGQFGQFRFCLQGWQIVFAILAIEKTILETCDIWHTDYNFDNWEPEFMTIFVTWQLIVTLDSIRNSCDVFHNISRN